VTPLRLLVRRRRRHCSLRTRLLVSSISLIGVVCAVVGAVTAVSLRSYLYDKLDSDVRNVVKRVSLPPPPGVGIAGLGQVTTPVGLGGPLAFVTGAGQPPGTLGAVTDTGGRVVDGQYSAPTGRDIGRSQLTAAQKAALSGIPADGAVHGVVLPGLGSYRVMAAASQDGVGLVIGEPAKSAQETVNKLIFTEICVTAFGLVAAGFAGAALTRYALRPLRRVAATATRVSELRLDRGEVRLRERVPSADTDPRTEVGQVGAALNRLLGHVGSALEARHASETQVRQFVADASHELRTPLASIRGYAELTRRGHEEIGPDTRHALGRIEAEASRMTTLVEDLLLLARLDAGRPLTREPLDLAPLVVDAVSDARAAGPGHRWRLELPDDPAVVRGDPARLQQMLVNLLANARTHTPPGTTVTARVTTRATGPAPEVRLEVTDNGPGIPAELLPHIFERFARGDVSRARAAGSGSTGLGLAIVQAVVVAHGGAVSVDSVPGRTVFQVSLPAAGPLPGDRTAARRTARALPR
jgi:two-component system, OmpR family, sensor kinase